MGLVYLTEHRIDPHTVEQAGAEVEVTPEMLAAGGAYVEAYEYGTPWLGPPSHRDLAKLVYLAMKRCEPR